MSVKLLAALGFEVIEPEACAELAKSSVFLEGFLADARAFWAAGKDGRLRSGPWIEKGEAGAERAREASAVVVDGQPYLVLETLGEAFEERRAALQEARDKWLEYERLQVRTREVERLNRLKDEFLASVSHELRTPLNAILGFTNLLREEDSGPLNGKQRGYLEHVSKAADHLLALINDVLDLSKIEAGVEDLRPEVFGFADAAREVVEGLRPAADAKNMRLELDAVNGLRLYADRRRFKQILYNLLNNAIKFTREGGEAAVLADADGGDVRVSVRDTGVGVAPDEREAIFDRFFQSSRTAKGVREGVGLGLAISKRLVELHGGRIWVVEDPSGGARFVFTMPSDQL